MVRSFLVLLGLVASAAAQSSLSTAATAPPPESTQPSSVLENATVTIDTELTPPGSDGAVKVTGLVQEDLAVFLGIPFAQPRKLPAQKDAPLTA